MKLLRFEVRWAETLGRTIAPRGLLGGVVDDVNLGELYATECAASPMLPALLMRLSLWLAWLAPPFVIGRLRSFGGLPQPDRERVLERLMASNRYNIRLAAMFLKLMVCQLLLGDRRALEHLGAYGLGDAGARDRAQLVRP